MRGILPVLRLVASEWESKQGMFRILLINMPFSDINRPSIGLSLLKAGLTQAGIACEVAYLNVQFAKLISAENYARIDTFSTSPLLGEWIFSEALFGDAALPDALSYYGEVLRPALKEPFGNNETAFREAVEGTGLLAGLVGLRKKAAHFLDTCFGDYDWEQYNIVGFTTTFQQSVASLALAKRIKAAYPKTLVAFGGANCEGTMGVTLHRLFPFIDLVCSGEGDKSFIDFATALAAGIRKPLIDGIIQRIDGKTMVPVALTNPIREMDTLPVPDYSDFFVERPGLPDERDNLRLPIESSRGCWWGEKAHCTFCGLNGGTMSFRTKSPERFLGEVNELVHRYGVRDLAAVDNIIDMQYFQSVLPRLAESGLGIRIFYETKSNLRRAQVKLLREAGVTHIQPGIESLSTSVLQLMRKGVHAYQNIRLLRLCAECLVKPSWNLLAGFPGEEPVEYEKQAEMVPFLTHLPPPTYVGCVRLDRFSPLFERKAESGVVNVRPTAAYQYIYPFKQDELADLGYYFDFDYADGRCPQAYVAPLHAAVTDWKRSYPTDSLISLDDGETLTIADRREGEASFRHVLRGWERVVYLHCEEGSTPGGIVSALEAANYHDVSRRDLEGLLSRFIRERVMLQIDGRYLALAVAGNYRLEVLSRYLKAGQDIPADVAFAVRQLFDLHPEAFADRLVAYLN
jgi:ribosomal peptide maturation radical SAM protein 1